MLTIIVLSTLFPFVIQIWDDNNPRMADYINVDVGYAIKPAQANITLGDVVCFTSPVVTASGMYDA